MQKEILNLINACQAWDDHFIPRPPMKRLIFEIANEFIQNEEWWKRQPFRDVIWFSKMALWAIQEDLECALTKTFNEVNLLAIANGRQTILSRDLKLVKDLRKVQFNDTYNWVITRAKAFQL